MVNIDEFTKKLEKILDYYSLSASSFADKIGVQRSSMSHLLSGRNKPSLDFVLKITEVFSEVDLYWLLLGKGEFPKNQESNSSVSTPILNTYKRDLFEEEIKEVQKTELNTVINTEIENPTDFSAKSNDVVEKIVIFYKNGTFKSYKPN